MNLKTQPDYLFVYGTLRKEFGLQLSKEIMNDISFVSSGAIKGELYDIGEYPAALPTNDENAKITGEIYEVNHPRKVFKLLDDYEGYDRKHIGSSEYYRKKEMLELDNGNKIKAWVYWYNFPVNNKMRINQSDYLQYLKNKIA